MGRAASDLPARTGGSARLRVLVADSHDVIRRTVRATLIAEPAWTVCAEATTGLETLAKVSELKPDVVIFDIGLPGMAALELTREIRRVAPGAHLVVLTMHPSAQIAHRLYEAGAHVCVTKADIGRSLIHAIKALVGLGMTDAVTFSARNETSDSAGTDDRADSANTLTIRERQVLQLLAEGKSSKEIGVALMISAKTVETYRGRIMSKLGLHSMNQLVRYAIRHRIISA